MLVNLKMTIAVRRMTQVDLALRLKISPTILSEIIHSRRQADSSLRARIAEALRADETWLFSTVARIQKQKSFGNPEAPQPTFAGIGTET